MPLDAVLPAFVLAALGYYAGKRFSLDRATISHITLHILTPAMAFNSLVTSTIDLGQAWNLAAVAFLFPFVEVALFLPLFKILKWDQNRSRAMLLASIFSNAGNYGLPVCLFAFGQEGMDLAVVFMVSQMILVYSLGTYLAASSQMDAKSAILRVVKMPAIWAAVAGLVVRLSGIELSIFITRPVGLLAQAAVPVLLLLLGVQLIGSGQKGESWHVPAIVVPLRLIVAPIIAAVMGHLMGVDGLGWKVLVLEAAMSTPVNATVLANEFNADPVMVSRVTAYTTVASVVTLTAWIAILRGL